MHAIGGGVAKECIYHLFDHAKARKRMTPLHTLLLNTYMRKWKKICEVVREVRDFSKMEKWKMREAHEFLMYLAVAFCNMPKFQKIFQDPGDSKKCVDALLSLIIGCHLIGGNFQTKPSQTDLDTAKRCFIKYLDHCVAVYGEATITYKFHLLCHLVEECIHFACHLGAFDAYAFENFLGVFRRNYVRTGKEVLIQIINHMKKDELYGRSSEIQPSDSKDVFFRPKKKADFQEARDFELNLVKKLKSLEIPPTTIISFSTDTLQCHGMTIKTKYPNNFVLL